MPNEIKDIEANLLAIFKRADEILRKGPAKHEPFTPPESSVKDLSQEVLETSSALVIDPVPAAPETIQLPRLVPALDNSEKTKFEIPFLIGFPAPLHLAAQTLWEGLERLQPKFTFRDFHLSGKGSIPYTLGQPLFATAFSQAHTLTWGVLFMITEQRLSKDLAYPFARELARCGFYFHEVSPEAVNHPESYDEFLLGLAFFLTTQKPLDPPQPS